MSDETVSAPGVRAHRPAAALCRWVVRPPDPTLHCLAHGVRTPGAPGTECDARPAVLCHVCLRAVVRCWRGSGWTLLCRTCSRIETTLAAPFGAPALTPHHRPSHTQAETLFGQRFPERVHQRVLTGVHLLRDGTPYFHTALELDGPDPLDLLTGHALASLGALAPSGARVPGEEWLAAHPASPRASARAYVEYVTRRHGWLRAELPRITDVDWLTAVAAPRAGGDRRRAGTHRPPP